MLIGVDINGGDYAPDEPIKGAILAREALPSNARLMLIGDEKYIKNKLSELKVDSTDFLIFHAPEVIAMHEHPAKAFQQKPSSSLAAGFGLLKQQKIDAFASAGNTGAMLVGAVFSIKTIPGIIRPCISSIVPKADGSSGIILDVGVNADCKPEMLQQFALLGSLLAEHVFNIQNPKVGLMSIGEEAEKGNAVTLAAHQLLKNSTEVNFIGNVEGRDLFNEKADVIVCDGFTGNIMLKEAEAFYELIRSKNLSDPYFERFNYESIGGAPVLGVNGNVIIAHGISKATAIKSMILLAHEVTSAKLNDKIKEALSATVQAS